MWKPLVVIVVIITFCGRRHCVYHFQKQGNTWCKKNTVLFISLLNFFSFCLEWWIINRFLFTLWQTLKKNIIVAQNMAQKFMRNLSVHHFVTPSFYTNKKLLIIINLLWKYQINIMWADVITLWIYFFFIL